MFVFHDFGDVNAVVTGFWKGLLGLFNVFFIDFQFLDAGVFPDVVLELRFKMEREGGVDGGILQLEGTGVGNFVHGNSFMKLPDLVGDVWAAQGNILIMKMLLSFSCSTCSLSGMMSRSHRALAPLMSSMYKAPRQ